MLCQQHTRADRGGLPVRTVLPKHENWSAMEKSKWWETRSSHHMSAAMVWQVDWTAVRRSAALSNVSLSCCVWWTLLKTICWDPKICSGRIVRSDEQPAAYCPLLFPSFWLIGCVFCPFSSSCCLCLWPAAVNVEQTCRCARCMCVCVCKRPLLQPVKGPKMRPKFETVSTQFIPLRMDRVLIPQ